MAESQPRLKRIVVKLPPAPRGNNVPGEHADSTLDEMFEQCAFDHAMGATQLHTLINELDAQCEAQRHEMRQIQQEAERSKQIQLRDDGYRIVQDSINYIQAIHELSVRADELGLLTMERQRWICDLEKLVREGGVALHEQTNVLREKGGAIGAPGAGFYGRDWDVTGL
ncbi:MAG: hypothetical protein Q9163_004527 [Psora crenata]